MLQQQQGVWSSSSCLYLSLMIYSSVVVSIEAVINLPENVKIPAILAFGDSIVDPGNNNYVPTIVKCNFSPYGMSFMGGKPTGRFCNGKIPTDLIAKAMGVKELLPAYLDPSLKPSDLLTGVSFASGASGYDPVTSGLLTAIGLSQQITLFKEYIGKLKAIAGEERTSRILAESFYMVVAGSDDIANTYFTTPLRRYNYDVQSYTDLMVQGASKFVQQLYDLGARRIAVFSAPPIGCVPSQRTLHGSKDRHCGENENRAAILFNSKLSSALDKLNTKFQGPGATYVDIYKPLLDIIINPRPYGFKVVNKGCCGTGNLEVSILCNKLTPVTCANASEYVFWDSYHPTERCYEVLVPPLVQKYAKTIFCKEGRC